MGRPGLAPAAVKLGSKLKVEAVRKRMQHPLPHQVAEALFYLWRLTQDPRFREYAWRLFTSLEKLARVETGGFSGLQANSPSSHPPSFFLLLSISRKALM